jgi:hypothetical protein
MLPLKLALQLTIAVQPHPRYYPRNIIPANNLHESRSIGVLMTVDSNCQVVSESEIVASVLVLRLAVTDEVNTHDGLTFWQTHQAYLHP